VLVKPTELRVDAILVDVWRIPLEAADLSDYEMVAHHLMMPLSVGREVRTHSQVTKRFASTAAGTAFACALHSQTFESLADAGIPTRLT